MKLSPWKSARDGQKLTETGCWKGEPPAAVADPGSFGEELGQVRLG